MLADMAHCAATFQPLLQIEPDGSRQSLVGQKAVRSGKLLIAFNHSTTLTTPAWWTAIALGGALDQIGLNQPEPRWVITSVLNYLGWLAPISQVALRQVAVMYNAFLMPSMPPVPQDTRARAATVCQVLGYLRADSNAHVCLAPQGTDGNDGKLTRPPSGAGRFMLQLVRAGAAILPAGVCENQDAWRVCFGDVLALTTPPALPPNARDEWATLRVMGAIAELLPSHLRGPF